MKKVVPIVGLLALIGLLALSTPTAFAQTNLLPCPVRDAATGQIIRHCTFLDFVTFIKNVIQFLLYIAIPLGVVMIVWGGFVIMTAGGNPGKVDNGKKIITAAAVGIAIAFGSWLIVTTVNRVLTGFFS